MKIESKIKDIFHNPISLILLVTFLMISGLLSFLKTPVRLYPTISRPIFTISYEHDEIHQVNELHRRFGLSINRFFQKLEGIEDFEVVYYNDYAQIKSTFSWESSEEEIYERINSFLQNMKLKENGDFDFSISTESENNSANLIVSFTGLETLPNSDFLIQTTLVPELNRIKGILDADYWGMPQSTIYLNIDRNLLIQYGISLDQIIAAIKKNIKTQSMAYLENGQYQLKITRPAEVDSFRDLEDIYIYGNKEKNLYIRLKDIGSIQKTTLRKKNIFRLNGNQAKFVGISIAEDADVKKVSRLAIKTIQNFTKKNRTSFNIMTNPADYIHRAIYSLLGNAIFGASMATLVLFFFIRSFKHTLVITISIPFSIIISFIFIKYLGLSINILTLGGMAMATGMILDSSIVVLENIIRNLDEKGDRPTKSESIEIILSSVKEVAGPLIISIATSIVVFVPLIFTKSYTKAILNDLSLSIIIVLASSLFSALLIVPLISSQLSHTKGRNLKSQDFLLNFYQKAIGHILKYDKLIYLPTTITIFLVTISVFLFPKIKKEIIAIPQTELLDIEVTAPGNRNIEFIKMEVNKIEKFLKLTPEIINFSTYLTNPSGGWITCKLKHRKNFNRLKNLILQQFPPHPKIRFRPEKWDPGRLPLPENNDLIITFSATSQTIFAVVKKKLEQLANKYSAEIWGDPDLANKEELEVKFRPWYRPESGEYFESYLQSASKDGQFIQNLMIKNQTIPFKLRFQEGQINFYSEQVAQTPVLYKNEIIPLSLLADIKPNLSQYLPRLSKNFRPINRFMLHFNEKKPGLKKKKISQFKKEAIELLKKQNINPNFPDPSKEIQKSLITLVAALVISIILIFMALSFLFNSIKYATVIMLTIPSAISGAIIGLYLMNSTISLNSFLGMILLSGLIVNNGILLVDLFHRKSIASGNIDHIILTSTLQRIRPIYVTALTTILGVLPILLGIGDGSEILRPLGIGLFFGLIIATIHGTFLVPTLLKITHFSRPNKNS